MEHQPTREGSDSSPRSSSTRTQRRALANRRSIVEAAGAIVATEGAAGLSLEALAARADVAVQTIYNRVGGRAAVLAAVAERAMEESRSYMDAAYAMEGSIEERLMLVARAYAQFARERPHEFRVLVEAPTSPEDVERISDLTRRQNAKLAEVIRSGMQTGVLRTDLDPERAATVFWATMNGLLALAWQTGSLRPSTEEIEHLLNVYIATVDGGLRAR